MNTEVVQEIKDFDWEHIVTRPGFIQSKSIVNDAEVTPISITPSVTLSYENVAWVTDINLYDKQRKASFPQDFKKAFIENKDWPLQIISYFERLTDKKESFIKKTKRNWMKEQQEAKEKIFSEYIVLLKKIQNHYVIAVPLTDYCEAELRKVDGDLLIYAQPYKKMDLDMHQDSLRTLKKMYEQNSSQFDELLREHLEKFGWIKTAYNIIQPYTKDDVLNEIRLDLKEVSIVSIPKHTHRHLIVGLRVGIYLRNRLKELAQQLWYYIEPVGEALAKDLSVTRDQFFQMTPEEVYDSLSVGKCTVSQPQFKQREGNFVLAYLHREHILHLGRDADELYEFFRTVDTIGIDSVEGTSACRGIVKGEACVVSNQKDFEKLKEGNILITTMTTPDFVVVMKRAAAIVTDEGGLSCHAAVVSRELGVPCVIGTKIATRVFKDGDMVEVDADKGIVKKI